MEGGKAGWNQPGSDNTWRGLDTYGTPIQISHDDLMKWANRKGVPFEIGWCTAFKMPDGKRLVRGAKMINAALERGWDDLADRLAAAGFTDSCDEHKTEET